MLPPFINPPLLPSREQVAEVPNTISTFFIQITEILTKKLANTEFHHTVRLPHLNLCKNQINLKSHSRYLETHEWIDSQERNNLKSHLTVLATLVSHSNFIVKSDIMYDIMCHGFLCLQLIAIWFIPHHALTTLFLGTHTNLMLLYRSNGCLVAVLTN